MCWASGARDEREAWEKTLLHDFLLSWTKNEKSKDYCKADLKQRVSFFIAIFRLAIPPFFRFTDVTSGIFVHGFCS